MTRARARAIENEVDSLLFEFHSDSHENWVLPHKDMLCILGYQGDDREKEKAKTRASTEQEKEGEVEKNEGEKLLDTPGTWTEGPRVPGLEDVGRAKPPGHPGCPAVAWASPQPHPGARPPTWAAPSSPPGARPAPPSHLRPPPGAWALDPRVPGPPTAGAPDRSGCLAGLPPGAQTTPRACVPLWVFTLVSPLLLLFSL